MSIQIYEISILIPMKYNEDQVYNSNLPPLSYTSLKDIQEGYTRHGRPSNRPLKTGVFKT